MNKILSIIEQFIIYSTAYIIRSIFIIIGLKLFGLNVYTLFGTTFLLSIGVMTPYIILIILNIIYSIFLFILRIILKSRLTDK